LQNDVQPSSPGALQGNAVLKKVAVIVALIVIAIGLLWWRARPAPLAVWIAPVGYGPVQQTVSNTRAGTIKACRRSKLSMPSGGVVDKLLVKKGDKVAAGQLLLELWNTDRRAEVDQARAALDAARSTRPQACVLAQRLARTAQRQQALADRKLIAVDAADDAVSAARAQHSACAATRAQVDAAAAQLELRAAMRDRSQLRAPFAGVVAEINGEIGEIVTPSPPGVATPPAVDLIDTSCLYATAPIDEVDAAALRLGQPVQITLDAFRGREFTGRLTRIAPYVVDLEKQARTVDVDVHFDAVPADVALLIGYSADITVVLKDLPRVLRVPTEALVDTNHIWVLAADGRLHRRELQLGVGNFTFTEVRGGLREGEQVVRSPDQPGNAEAVRAVARRE
jgi:HlyD family secretion protein